MMMDSHISCRPFHFIFVDISEFELTLKLNNREEKDENNNNAIEKKDFFSTLRNEKKNSEKYEKLHNIKTFEPTNIYILMIPIYFNGTLGWTIFKNNPIS